MLSDTIGNMEEGKAACRWFVDELDADGRCQAASLDDSCFISLFLWFSKRSSVRGAKTAPIALKGQKIKRLYDQFANKKRSSCNATAGSQSNSNVGNSGSIRNSCLKAHNTGGRSNNNPPKASTRMLSPSLERSRSPSFISADKKPDWSETSREKEVAFEGKPPISSMPHATAETSLNISERFDSHTGRVAVRVDSTEESSSASEIIASKLAASKALKALYSSNNPCLGRTLCCPVDQEMSLTSAHTLHNYVRLAVVGNGSRGVDVLTLDHNFLSEGTNLLSLALKIIQNDGPLRSDGFLSSPPDPLYRETVMNGEVGVDIWPSWLFTCSKAFWTKDNNRGSVAYACSKSAAECSSMSEEDSLSIPFHLILLARIELSIWGAYWRHCAILNSRLMSLSENAPETLASFLESTSSSNCVFPKSKCWAPLSHSLITLTEESSSFTSLFSPPISLLPHILDKARKLSKYGDEIGMEQSMMLLKPFSSFDPTDFSGQESLDKILLMPISWILAEGKDEGGNYGGPNHPVRTVLKEVEHLWAEHAAQQLITSEGAVKSSTGGSSKRKKKKKKKKRKQSVNAAEKSPQVECTATNSGSAIGANEPPLSKQSAKNELSQPTSPCSQSCTDSTVFIRKSRSDSIVLKPDDVPSLSKALVTSTSTAPLDSTAPQIEDNESGDWEKVESRGKKGRRRAKNQSSDTISKVVKPDKNTSASSLTNKDQVMNNSASSPSRSKSKKTIASRRRQVNRKFVKDILIGVLDIVDVEITKRRKQAAKELNEERRKINEERRRLRSLRTQTGSKVRIVPEWGNSSVSKLTKSVETNQVKETIEKDVSKDSSTQTELGFKVKQDQGTAVTVSETVSGSEEVKSFASDLAVNTKLEHPPTLLSGPGASSSNSSVASSLEIPQINSGEMHLSDVCDQLTADSENFMRRRAMACTPRRYGRASLIAALQDAVGHLWAGRCRVEPYGSCATLLDLPSSDLDLVIYGLQPRQKKKKFREHPSSRIARLAAELEKLDWAVQIKPISTAIVPVIKVLADPSRLGIMPINYAFNDTTSHWRGADILNGLTKVDITFEGPEHGGIGSSFYVARVVEQASLDACLPPEQTVLVQLLMILKELLAQKRLNEPFSGGLSSYGLLLLVEAMIRHANIVKARIESRRSINQNAGSSTDSKSNLSTSELPVKSVLPPVAGGVPPKSWASITKIKKDASPSPHAMTYAEKIAAAMREEIDDESSVSDRSGCGKSQVMLPKRVDGVIPTKSCDFNNDENELSSDTEVLLGIDDNEDSTDGIDVLYEGDLTVGKMLMLFLVTYGKHFDARTMAVDVSASSKKSPFVRRKSSCQIDTTTGVYSVDPLVIYDPIYPGENKNVSRSSFAFPSIQWMFNQCFTTLKHTVNRRIQQGDGDSSALLELLIAY